MVEINLVKKFLGKVKTKEFEIFTSLCALTGTGTPSWQSDENKTCDKEGAASFMKLPFAIQSLWYTFGPGYTAEPCSST